MRRLFLLALLILHTSPQIANQKGFVGRALASAAQSEGAHRWNELAATGLGFSGSPASKEMQELANAAQEAVGIPFENRVPVRQGSTDGAAAIADFNAIYINPELFAHQDNPHGVKQCDLHHEAVHIKYHDSSCSIFLKLATNLGAPLLTCALQPQGKLKALYPLSLLVGIWAGRLVQRNYMFYCERRADSEGHYATGCYMCVREKAKDIKGTLECAHQIIQRCQETQDLNPDQKKAQAWSHDFIKSKAHYLSVDENEAIAADLEKQRKLCAFHKTAERTS